MLCNTNVVLSARELTLQTTVTTMSNRQYDNVSCGPQMKFKSIELDPAKNPAVLDTATWDTRQAWIAISSVDES